MASYNYNGQVYDLPDGMDPNHAAEVLKQVAGPPQVTPSPDDGGGSNPDATQQLQPIVGSATPSTTAGTLGSQDSIDPATLVHDKDWLDASRKIYKYNNPTEFQGTDQDLAEYGLDTMGWFNYNLPYMAVSAARLRSADDDTRKAFVHMMDKYDNLQMSWSGTGRFVEAAGLDPTNWTGLASMGIGTIASTGAKVATKQGLKELLKAGFVSAVDAAVINSTANSIQQNVRINAGTQKDFDYGELAVAGGTGALVGEAIGAGARGAGKLLGKETGLVPVASSAKPSASEALQSAQEAVGRATTPEATTLPATSEKAATDQPSRITAANDNGPSVEPPIPDNHVRVYHSGQEVGPDETGRWVSTNKQYASDYRADQPLHYLDLHENDPRLQGSYPDQGPKQGFTFNFETTADEARGLKQIARDGENFPVDVNSSTIGGERPTTPAANDNVDTGANGSGNGSGETPAPNSIIAALKQYAGDTGARIFSTWDKMSADSAAATDIITKLKPDEANTVIEAVRRGELNPEATVLAKAAFASATQKLGDELAANRAALDIVKKQKGGDPNLTQELQNRANDLQTVYDTVRSTDLAFSSITGHELRNRVGMTNTNDFRDVSPDSIIRERKLEPALYGKDHSVRREAEAEFQRRLVSHQEQIEHDATVMKLEQEANDLFQKGDMAGSILKNEDANAMREARALKLAEDNPLSFNAKLAGVAHTGWQGAVEYVISTVFKTSTLLVNLVPHLILTPTRPMIDFMVRGGGSEAYAMMKASYSMMHMNVGEALQASLASFRYEADLLGKHGPDSANKFLETSGIIPGVYGRIIRTFPRLLTATDQFFKRTNYTSYVASYSASEAFKDGLQLGLKSSSPEMKAFVDGVVTRSVSHAFAPPEHGISVLNFLRQQGIRRGIDPGPKLNQFIQQELAKNGNLFATASSESGRMFADDMAFRREFSGNGFTSKMAQGYEKFTNNHPWMKFFGQLFFRTPVRVFEEGIRLTPGIQFAAPGFFRDLRGAGIGGAGGTAQVRAQAEAMAALAFAGVTFNAYSQGKISGGGQTDWRLGKNQVNSGYQPYTYKFDDGTDFNFRNFDPFATPFKVMVNALDHITELEYRHAQGEDIDQTTYQQAAAHVYMPALAVIQSIKDANLAEGLSELVELGHDLSDPTKSGDAFTRFISRKAQLAIPNQYTTIAQITMANGSDFHDPKTFDQYILARVNPGAGTIPKRYDPLGNDLKNANPMSGLWGVPITTTKAQRDNALDTKSQAVNQVLGAISVATNQTFIPGYTAAQWAAGSGFPSDGLGGLDLRTKLTSDGKETMYDRLNRYVQQSDLKEQLYKNLVLQSHAMGTPSGKGPAAQFAHDVITMYRGAAFVRLAKEESIFQPLVRAAAAQKAYSESGLREAGGAPFQ